MKIAIIGTHGTFKTTLVYFLAGVLKAKGKSVGIIREMATACPYFKDGRGNVLAQNWITLNQVQLEREYEEIYDYVICDRSVVDNYIYAMQAYQKENQPLPGWIEPFVLHHTKSYDFLFKTPISPLGLVNDGVRSVDRKWQQEIEDQLTQYLEEKKIKHIELPVSEVFEYDDIIEYATKQAKFMATYLVDMDVQKRIF
ncbi:ATP-binding protein [Candidatus Woesearchaeota archaeon]|nr:ATP-binding protein [Candidatus Woesearchaeota archaeon]